MDNKLVCAFALVCGLVLVTSTPIIPEVNLQRLHPVDACLFMCNICFDQEDPKMMVCANDVCLGPTMQRGFSSVWLGRHCKKYEKLVSLVGTSGMKTLG